jgi:hypothetical protein
MTALILCVWLPLRMCLPLPEHDCRGLASHYVAEGYPALCRTTETKENP